MTCLFFRSLFLIFISVRLGSLLVTILGNYEAIKEAFVKQGENFAGKPEENAFRVREDQTGIGLMEGETWKEHRRFILSTFRDFGMGKQSLEPKIMDEIHHFLKELAKQNGAPVDPNELLSTSVTNVVSAMEFGCRFEYDDKEFLALRADLADLNKLVSAVGVLLFFPWANRVPILNRFTGRDKLEKFSRKFEHFLKSRVEQHQQAYETGSKKDFIDAYLTARSELSEKPGNEDKFTINELEGNLGALFAAGSETTNTTLKWILLYIFLYPEVKVKVLKEIDDVIGIERAPSMSDRSNMPYTEAFLMEVHRHASVVPLTLVHSNHEDATVLGCVIPKRSYVIANLWAVHNDPDLWDKPEKFTPERFFNENGELVRPEYLIPFGAGKRNCIGESLAKMEIFLYFTAMLQRFDFLPPKRDVPNLGYTFGITRCPKPFKIRAIQREGYHVA